MQNATAIVETNNTLSTPNRSKSSSSDAKRMCLVDASDNASLSNELDYFDVASARAKNHVRALEIELQLARDNLSDALERLEEKHGVKTVEQEMKECKERDRKRPPPANVCLDIQNLPEVLEEYNEHIKASTDGKGALLLSIHPPTQEPELALKLVNVLRSSTRFANTDETGIVLYGPHRGATVKVLGQETDGKILARSIGSHTSTIVVEGQSVDKWSNNQTLLLDAESVGSAN